MWNVDPKFLCRQHLLGEHKELHQLVDTVLRKKSIAGYIERNLIDPSTVYSRHMILSFELKRRGYKHESPMSEKVIKLMRPFGKIVVDIRANENELIKRCPECLKNIKEKRNAYVL